MRLLVLFTLLMCTSACGSLFLYPDKVNYSPEAAKHVLFEEGVFINKDGQKLHYWFVPAQQEKKAVAAKGLVIQVHGNAQNLTSHVRSLGWLPTAGYSLVIFDYRGYGQSEGRASLEGAYSDVSEALDFFTQNLNPNKLPVYFWGQSLGGTLLLKTVSSSPGRWQPEMVIIESAFYSYTGIAREKLAMNWITWPLQWLPYLVIPNRFSLKDSELQTVSPIPVYLFYSENDPIVPAHNGENIFKELKEPKFIYLYPEAGHINSMWIRNGKFREVLLAAMTANVKKN